jgi:hypothetical protein
MCVPQEQQSRIQDSIADAIDFLLSSLLLLQAAHL